MKLTRNIYFQRCYLIIVAVMCSPGIILASGLGSLLHQVEQKAPQLHAASARADASAAGIRIAKSQYWGHGEVFGQTTHYNSDRLVNPIGFPPVLTRSLFDQNTYGIGAAYTLPLDVDGRIAAKVHAQEHLSQAAHQSAAQTRLVLFAQTVSLYRGLQRLEGVKQAHLAHLKALQGHRKVTAISVEVGRIAAVELLRIEAEIKSVEGLLAGLNGDEVRLRATLGALLNQVVFTDKIEILSVAPVDQLSSENGDESLKNRPDLMAATSITRAENENLKGAKREWLPNLSLRAETLRNQGYTAIGANTWSVGAQVSWQFWDGGRRFANSDRALANKEAARQQYQSTLNQARAELQSAMAGWQAASLQYQAATSGLKSATETERIQSDRFSNGRISAVDLIDAEAALARARADHTTALANWWLADDQLYLARGHAPSAYTQSGDQ
jgi:multidrug efflux system outer membrane protein